MKRTALLIVIMIAAIQGINAQNDKIVHCISRDSIMSGGYPPETDVGPRPNAYVIDTDRTTTDNIMYDFNSALEYLKQTISPDIVTEYDYESGIYTFLILLSSDSTAYYQGDGKYAYNPYAPDREISWIYQYGSKNQPYLDAYPLWFATLDLSDNKTENILIQHNVTYRKGGTFYTLNAIRYSANLYIYPYMTKKINGRTFVYASDMDRQNTRHYFMYDVYGKRYPKIYFVHLRTGHGYKVQREYVLEENTAVNEVSDERCNITVLPGIVNRSEPITVKFKTESLSPYRIVVTSITGATEMSIDVNGEEPNVSIDTSMLSTGLHIVSVIRNGAIVKTAKIVIK